MQHVAPSLSKNDSKTPLGDATHNLLNASPSQLGMVGRKIFQLLGWETSQSLGNTYEDRHIFYEDRAKETTFCKQKSQFDQWQHIKLLFRHRYNKTSGCLAVSVTFRPTLDPCFINTNDISCEIAKCFNCDLVIVYVFPFNHTLTIDIVHKRKSLNDSTNEIVSNVKTFISTELSCNILRQKDESHLKQLTPYAVQHDRHLYEVPVVTQKNCLTRPTSPPLPTVEPNQVSKEVIDNPTQLLKQPLHLVDRQRRKKDALLESVEDATDNLKWYKKQIGRYPLLSPLEETRLFKDYETNGKKDKAIKHHLITRNLRLVVDISKKHHHPSMHLELLDLIQEGNLGLYKAIDKFDITRGFKFSTYATWWIRQAIMRFVADKERLIRLPVHMVEQVNNFRKRRQLLVDTYSNTNIDIPFISEKLGYGKQKVAELIKYEEFPVSLEESHLNDEYTCMLDGRDPHIKIEEILHPKETSERVYHFLMSRKYCNLSPREALIIILRFGLHDHHDHYRTLPAFNALCVEQIGITANLLQEGRYTLEEVGQLFEVTRERIRQVEAKALKKLRHPNRSKYLLPYLDI